jgi:tetratricopeptide (TPR) repeat protein
MISPKYLIFLFSIIFFFVACSPAFQLGKFDKVPQPSTPDQEALIEEGIVAHDQGDYDIAIQKYEEVLTSNPDNPLALYELSTTHFMKHDWQRSLRAALKGTEYDSPYKRLFYSVIGSCLSNMQRSKDAISVFKNALEHFPDDYMLHYNLGIAYYMIDQIGHSKKSFKKVLAKNPQHASSHLGLANSLYNENNEIPALLAYCRFLILEPNSQRTMVAQERVLSIIGTGVKEDTSGGGDVNINVYTNTPTSEGDFGTVRFSLSMLTAMAITENPDQDEAKKVSDIFNSLFKLMAEQTQREEKTGFGWEFYVPYFIELQSRGFVETFIQHIFQLEDADEMQIAKFLEWSESY